jgi:PhnB protein
MMTHGELPNASEVPPHWKNAILHARLSIGETVLMGADIPPERFKPMRSAYLSLLVSSTDEAERIYSLLSDGGEIFMPMEETFFAFRFAMLRDKFGTSWMILHERPS